MPTVDDDPELFIGESFVLTVKGSRTVQPWETELHVVADHLSVAAAQLGLIVTRDPVTDLTHRRRWTLVRRSRDDVLRYVQASADGRAVAEIATLYQDKTPWLPLDQVNAENKVRVHLHRLRQAHRVVKRYDQAGKERWHAL